MFYVFVDGQHGCDAIGGGICLQSQQNTQFLFELSRVEILFEPRAGAWPEEMSTSSLAYSFMLGVDGV